jgi:hypothetical protein
LRLREKIEIIYSITPLYRPQKKNFSRRGTYIICDSSAAGPSAQVEPGDPAANWLLRRRQGVVCLAHRISPLERRDRMSFS